MLFPAIDPLMIPAAFNSLRCCEIVAWASGSSSTMVPQTQLCFFNNSSTMAIRAGCARALAINASWFCLFVNALDLDAPIIVISQYYDKKLKGGSLIFFRILSHERRMAIFDGFKFANQFCQSK